MAAAAQAVMLAQKYDDKIDPTGWYMSEKLDGVRAYWSGSKFFSRQGNQFIAPDWFTKDLPKEPLDGELWCGRGLFQKTLSIIKKTKDPEKYFDDWKYVTYLIFDAPGRSSAGVKYEQRVAWLEDHIKPQSETTYAAVVGVCKCTGRDHLGKMLKQVLMKGGEGIMLRKAGSLYENCRSHTLLKVKFFHDEEAKCGKIHCVLPNGVAFKIGTGFSDAQRKSPPKIGSVVTFKYQEMSDHGHPRFPVFLRERKDMTWADVLANAKTKAPFSSLKKKAVPLLQKQHSILFSVIPSRDQESGKKVVTTNDADDETDDAARKGLLLTKGNGIGLPAAAAAAAASASPPAGSRKRGADAAASSAGKPLCRYHPNCFQKSQAHKDSFDHPAAVGDVEEDEEDIPEGSSQEPRNKDMPDDSKDEDYVDGPEGKGRRKKRAKTAGVTSPSAPSSSSAAAAASPASPSKPAPSPKVCWYGAACYNKDSDHLRRFTHPAPPPSPKTKEEFIATTNQSQHDLAEYYKFGGDEEEDEVAEMLVADKNERRLSIQKFNENKDDREEVRDDEDEDEAKHGGGAAAAAAAADDHDEVRTVAPGAGGARKSGAAGVKAAVAAVAKKAAGYFEACASDDDEEGDKGTVLVKDLPKVAPRPVRTPTTASSSAETIPPKPRGAAAAAAAAAPAAVARQPSQRLAAAAATSGSSSATAAGAGAGVGIKCSFILPELLAKPATRIIETEDGEELCKRCKQPVGDHRESRKE